MGMLEREFNAVKRNLRYTECGTRQTNAQKLCTILALAMVFANEPFWMHDNEDPEAVATVLKDLAIYLRTNLLKLSDAELELGAAQLVQRCTSYSILSRLGLSKNLIGDVTKSYSTISLGSRNRKNGSENTGS